MRIATWNVNGVRAREAQLLEWLGRERPDVVCLQEIKASPEQCPDLLCRGLGYAGVWHGHKGYSGVALLLGGSRPEGAPAPRFFHPTFDHEHRIVAAELGPLVLASVYVPNGGKDFPAKLAFLEAMVGWAAGLRAEGKHLVLAGDFNVARTDRDVHPKERKPVTGQLPEERALIEALLARGGLVDVGRHVEPDRDDLYTWWAPWRQLRERNIGWRLDYVAASAALVDAATKCAVYREVGTSDHGPVIAELGGRPLVS